MKLIERVHDTSVHTRRIRALQRHIAALLPPQGGVLDVGCGDGLLAHRIGEELPGVTMTGIDVLVRDNTHIPVTYFDGVRIPYDDNSFDAVMFVDVLHHTDDPMVLLKEAARVARCSIVMKDHLRNGLLANATLRFMDKVGNAHHGVALPFTYWSKLEWQAAFRELHLNVDVWLSKLGLYPIPADWIFGRSLHFVTRLTFGI